MASTHKLNWTKILQICWLKNELILSKLMKLTQKSKIIRIIFSAEKGRVQLSQKTKNMWKRSAFNIVYFTKIRFKNSFFNFNSHNFKTITMDWVKFFVRSLSEEQNCKIRELFGNVWSLNLNAIFDKAKSSQSNRRTYELIQLNRRLI